MDANQQSSPKPFSPDPATIEYTELLLECMQTRLDLLRSIKHLGSPQADALGTTDINVTLGILARKQGLLDELAAVNERLQPYFNDEPDQRVWQSEQRREECRRIADDGNKLLHETINADQAALEEVNNRRQIVAAQLQEGKDSIIAHSAYTAGEALERSSLDIADL